MTLPFGCFCQKSFLSGAVLALFQNIQFQPFAIFGFLVMPLKITILTSHFRAQKTQKR